MILDAELLFFDKKTLSATTLTSDIVYVGEGDAGNPLTLFCQLADPTGDSGSVEVEVITGSDADFSDAKTLGKYTAPFATKMPRGNLGYLKASAVSTYTGGTITAALVSDDDIL